MTIKIPIFSEIVKEAVDLHVSTGDLVDEPVICTCTEEHDGRPGGREGCGAYWNFIL